MQVDLGISKTGHIDNHNAASSASAPAARAAPVEKATHHKESRTDAHVAKLVSVVNASAVPSSQGKENKTAPLLQTAKSDELKAEDREPSMTDLILTEIEFELSAPATTDPVKFRNKVILVLLEICFVPACCGIDRCYMGQPCLGVIKGITLGGFGLWGLLDMWTVLINGFKKYGDIAALGFHAHFGEGQIMPAYYLSLLYLILIFFSFCTTFCSGFVAAIMGWKQPKQQPLPPSVDVSNRSSTRR